MAHFLALDPVFEVKASERGHGNPFVRELPVEVHGPLLHGQACPLLECARADQKVHVLRIQLAHSLIGGEGSRHCECLTANVLNFVLSQVQGGGNDLVAGVLEGFGSRLGGSEPDHQRSGPECGPTLLVHSLIFHFN